jgi:hypothetical protein
MAFSVIAPAPSLSASELEIAVASGPAFVDVPGGYDLMLRQSGWQPLMTFDVTAEFTEGCAHTSITGMNARQCDRGSRGRG